MPTYRNHAHSHHSEHVAVHADHAYKARRMSCDTVDNYNSSSSTRTDDCEIQHPGGEIASVKNILKGFLIRLPYRAPHTPPNADLRREVMTEIISWNTGLSQAFIEGLTDTSCVVAECAYAHTTYRHQLLVAIYTAYLTYTDDQGQNNVESVGQFVQRYAKCERQSNVALEHLSAFLGTIHDYYPRISSDAIITNTLDAVTAMYIELVTKGDAVAPDAARYPYYLRLKTGIASAYAHFMFMKSWGDGAGTYYLQLLPELELVIVGINDILSFYKETLAGETDNYIHMRATAERKSPILVLRKLVEEVLESVGKIERLTSAQAGLTEICMSFLMGYVEFHFNARRYRMEDLEVDS